MADTFSSNIHPNVPGLDPSISTGQRLTTRTSRFLASASADAVIAALVDPFASGSTYATVGTVPAQLALSGSNIVKGAGVAVAGSEYKIRVMATSADGLRDTSAILSFTATDAVVTPTPSPTYSTPSLSSTLNQGAAASGVTITNVTSGATATLSGPGSAGLTLSGSGTTRTVSGTPTSSGDISVTQSGLSGYTDKTTYLGAVAAGYTDARLMGERFAWPTSKTSAANSGTQHGGGGITLFSPPYVTYAPRFCWAAMYSNGITTSSVNNTEVALGNNIAYAAQVVEIEGVIYPLKIGGSTAPTVLNGGYAWNDADFSIRLPANTAYRLLWADDVGVGGFRPITGVTQVPLAHFSTLAGKGDGYSRLKGATYAADILAGITPAPSAGSDIMCGPCLGISYRLSTETLQIPLVLGHSIDWGSRHRMAFYGSRPGHHGNFGMTGIGLDSATGGRVPHGNLAVPSQRMADLSDFGFAKRKQMLADVGAPFDLVLLGGVRNEASAAADLNALKAEQTRVDTWVQTSWPGKRIVAMGCTPITSAKDDGNVAANYKQWSSSSDTDQFLSSNEIAIVQPFNAWRATLPNGINGFIKVHEAVTTAGGKWLSPNQHTSWVSGGATGQPVVTVADASIFQEGDFVVAKTGQSTAMSRIILSIAGNALTLNTNFSTAMVSGDTIDGAAVDDGLHPGTQSTFLGAARIIAGKPVIQGTQTVV